jgi:hypothetical protein
MLWENREGNEGEGVGVGNQTSQNYYFIFAIKSKND